MCVSLMSSFSALLNVCSVFVNSANSDVLHTTSYCLWTITSALAYQRKYYSSYNNTIQRPYHRKTRSFLGTQYTRWPGGKLRAIGLRLGIRMWRYLARIHRQGIPLCWISWRRGLGLDVRLIIPDLGSIPTDKRSCRPAFIAGVTNPIFETSAAWDLLMDIGTGRVVVHRDIHLNFPTTPPAIGPFLNRQAIRAEGSATSEEEIARIATRDKETNQKTDFAVRADSLDNIFMEEARASFPSTFLLWLRNLCRSSRR